MRPPTDKIVACVRAETCLLEDDGAARPEAVGRMGELSADHYLIVVSPLAQSSRGLSLLMYRLSSAGIPYDEVWCGTGVPEADVWYDAVPGVW